MAAVPFITCDDHGIFKVHGEAEAVLAALPPDVRAVALPVLQHRVITNYRATGAGKKSRDIVAELLLAVQEKSY